MADLLNVERALEHILAQISQLPSETNVIHDALGRVLGEDIVSDIHLPPFPNSAMDGYAVRAADVQSAAAAGHRLPVVMSEASPRVQIEWRNRIAAEYGSAAITQNFVLWLIQIAASPDLIEDGLVIVQDELAHSQLSAAVHAAAGGCEPPAIDRDTLGLARRPEVALELDVLRAAVQVFCLNETVAVPLFAHMREGATVEIARTARTRSRPVMVRITCEVMIMSGRARKAALRPPSGEPMSPAPVCGVCNKC